MKNSNTIVRLFTATVALLVAVIATPVKAATPAGATYSKALVVKVVGNASYVDAKGGDGAVREGMTLGQGTSIITGTGAYVTLDLGLNGDALTVNENSTIVIDTLTLRETGAEKAATTELEAKRGSLSFNVKKLSAASKYEVKTANGVAGIRGSRGIIYAVGVYQCLDGSLLVRVRNLTTGQVQVFTVTRANALDASRGAAAPIQLTPIPQATFEQLDKKLIAQTTILVPAPPRPTNPLRPSQTADGRNDLTSQIGALINFVSPTTPPPAPVPAPPPAPSPNNGG